MSYYIQPHVTQFDGAPLQGEACVPASLANGVAAQSGGVNRPSSGAVHKLIPKADENSPGPGWSIEDADHAMAKLGVPFTPGEGWSGIENGHHAGHYMVVQGDSDRFSNSTCSGAFNGDHCIGIHPNSKTEVGVEYWWIDDPICKTGRWEKKATILAYAQKLASEHGWPIHWGMFNRVVPQVAVPKPPSVTLRYGGKALHGTKRVAVAAGRFANVRPQPNVTHGLAPSRAGAALNGGSHYLPNKAPVEFFQRTTTGQLLAGSRVWYGDRTGTRWLHTTSF